MRPAHSQANATGNARSHRSRRRTLRRTASDCRESTAMARVLGHARVPAQATAWQSRCRQAHSAKPPLLPRPLAEPRDEIAAVTSKPEPRPDAENYPTGGQGRTTSRACRYPMRSRPVPPFQTRQNDPPVARPLTTETWPVRDAVVHRQVAPVHRRLGHTGDLPSVYRPFSVSFPCLLPFHPAKKLRPLAGP